MSITSRVHHHLGLARTRLCAGAAVLAAACILTGCAASGSPVAAAAPSTHAGATAAAPVDPEMVMVTLSDRGYRASDIEVGVGRTLMLMVMNPGTRAHELRTSIPLSGLQTENPATPAAADAGAQGSATGFDITVPAGQEIDVTLIPTAAGAYPMRDGSASVGALVAG